MLSVDENWVRHVTGPDPGPKGAFSISACRSSLVSGHYTDTPLPELAKPPSPDSPPQDARQTLLSGHVPNPRAERSACGPSCISAHTSSGSGLRTEVKRLVVRRKHDDGGPRLNRSLAPFDDSALPCCGLSFAHVVAELR